MKLFAICLTVFTALAFAEGHAELGARHAPGDGIVSTDGVVFSQVYSFANLINGYRHIEMADDLILSATASIQNIRVWMIYTGGMPTDYDLAFAQDAGDSDPNNATYVWSETVPCTHVDTGDDNWGFDIYETTCAISPTDTYPSLTAGLRYWLILVFKGDEFWLVEDPVWGSYAWTYSGTTWYRTDDPYTFDYAVDAFFELYDSPVPIERETWGSRKPLF